MNTRRLLAIVTLLAAFLPIIHWYGLRLGNGGGEPFGLVSLALAISLAAQHRHAPSPRLAELSILLYALGIFFLPPLLRTIPALATIAFLTGMHRQAGQFGLLLLSLPVQASLDFFLGYPFRLITAEGSRLLIANLGLPVERLGVQLSHQGVIVSVDPPCSGLQMLWATALLTALLSALFRLSYRQTITLSLAALTLCLLANVLRATVLFFPESGMISLPGFLHDATGLLFFALAGATLITLARKLHHPTRHKIPRARPISRRFLTFAFGASLITLVPAKTTSSTPAEFDTLSTYQGQAVEEIPLSPREETFARNFPGQLKIYQAGEDTLIIRRVTKASRMLHPAHHCLRAEGFTISHSRIRQDDQGRASLVYQATRNNERILVTEMIRDHANQHQWTEVSAWYWHALFHPGSGPWEAETLLSPLSNNHE